VVASVLQALHGLSDRHAADAVTFDLRWKAACGLAVTDTTFHATGNPAPAAQLKSVSRRALPCPAVFVTLTTNGPATHARKPSLRRPNRHFADHTPPISIFIHDDGAIGRMDDGQHLVSIRRAAIREERQRMSAQELADRLGMSRSRVNAVLASADNATGPLTVHYRTADGGVGEAPVAWTFEPLRGTRRIRVTREEIRYRRTAPVVMVVVPADSVDVEPTPTDSRLDGAFRSLENQAAYALSQADLAAQHAPDQPSDPASTGVGWRLQVDGEPSPRWPRTRYVAVRSWWGLQDH